jgi:hypothetical protein
MSQLYFWFTKECRKTAVRGGVWFGGRVRPIEVPPETLQRHLDAQTTDATTRMQHILEERTDPHM